jgi:hypothetical protein
MGMYNILKLDELTCPYCGSLADPKVEFKIGELDLSVYRLRDKPKWSDNRKKGYRKYQQIRPNNGNYLGYGYTNCPHCHQHL